ncbi:MAG: hypothetical protein Q9168_005652 [Polycauliona sp. 1 TL-2023]
MNSTFDPDMFATAMGLPSFQLTPESRYHEYYVAGWHRASDEDINKGLDSLGKGHFKHPVPSDQSFYPDRYFTDSTSGATIMADAANSTGATTTSSGFLEEIDENMNPGHSEPTDSPPPHLPNEFGHHHYLQPDEHDSHGRVSEEAHPDSTPETKQEAAPTAVMTSSIEAGFQGIHRGDVPPFGSEAMQRNFSAPAGHSAPWLSDDSNDAPPSYYAHDPPSSMAQHATLKKLRAQHHSSNHSARAQTYNQGPTSYARQNGVGWNPSGLSNTQAAWRHIDPLATLMGPYQNQARPNNYLANVDVGYVSGYYAGNNRDLPGFNQPGGKINNHHVNSSNFQHNNHDGPLLVNYNEDLQKIQQQHVLKSQQPSFDYSNVRSELVEDKSEQDHMDEQERKNQDPKDKLQYHNIESAREAERPKFKTKPEKDLTIPMNDEDKRKYVHRMVRCMKKTSTAQDNAGMIGQWVKLCQDEARMEQAAWRLLDMALQLHVEGIPLLPNRPSCNRYASMEERWKAICKGLQTQKTMCKHLLGSEFAAQLVNDPTTATQRVQNNRKVNAGKKSYYDKGRRLTHDARSSRRGSSASTQFRPEYTEEDGNPYGDVDDGIGNMGDEDAEGETDEEYVKPAANARVERTTTTTTSSSALAAPPRRKRELEHDDSGEYGGRAKKRRSTTKTHQTAPKRHIKNPRPEGGRSKFQLVGGKMIELDDKNNERLVYSQGTAHVQELYNKIHYPHDGGSTQNGRYGNGHATSRYQSRQPPRQARPGHSLRDDTSTEADDLFSDPRNEEGGGQY